MGAVTGRDQRGFDRTRSDDQPAQSDVRDATSATWYCLTGTGVCWRPQVLGVANKIKLELQRPRTGSLRRNNFIIQAVNAPRWGSAWGAIAMTDTEDLEERREQLLRYCAMERESTDPLALGLLHDIVLELQADLQAVAAKLRRLAEPQPNILK